MMAQINGLKDHLSRLDQKLADELAREQALADQLEAEKVKEAALDLSLVEEKLKEAELGENLKKVKAELAKDEKQLAADKKMLSAKDDEIADLKEQLAAAGKRCTDTEAKLDGLKGDYDMLRFEHDQCPPLIAALRKQIRDTKAALEMDEDDLDDARAKALASSLVQEVKANEAKKGGLMSALRSYLPGRKQQAAQEAEEKATPKKDKRKRTYKSALRQEDTDEESIAVLDTRDPEDRKLEVSTISGIALLRKELNAVKKAHAPCESTIAVKDDQVKELQAHLQRLDKELADEIEEEHQISNQLLDERRQHAELQAELSKTQLELENDERQLAECKNVIYVNEAEIADLKRRLASAEKVHEPCCELIESLRKQVAGLELNRDYLQVSSR